MPWMVTLYHLLHTWTCFAEVFVPGTLRYKGPCYEAMDLVRQAGGWWVWSWPL